MTRSELIERILLKKYGLDPGLVELAVKKIFEQMLVALERGDRIEIRGFGSFSLRVRMPRIARNPKTGEKVQTKLKRALHFKAGKELRERVNVVAESCS